MNSNSVLIVGIEYHPFFVNMLFVAICTAMSFDPSTVLPLKEHEVVDCSMFCAVVSFLSHTLHNLVINQLLEFLHERITSSRTKMLQTTFNWHLVGHECEYVWHIRSSKESDHCLWIHLIKKGTDIIENWVKVPCLMLSHWLSGIIFMCPCSSDFLGVFEALGFCDWPIGVICVIMFLTPHSCAFNRLCDFIHSCSFSRFLCWIIQFHICAFIGFRNQLGIL